MQLPFFIFEMRSDRMFLSEWRIGDEVHKRTLEDGAACVCRRGGQGCINKGRAGPTANAD